MTSPPPLLPPVQSRLTVLGRWRAALASDPAVRRALGWLAPTLLTLFAALLRLANLDHPHELAFDETYYVKDAWSLWLLGYEGTWSDGANAAFNAGDADAIASALDPKGSFVVHPPLGKWLIALGMALTGPTSSFGWRVSVAVLGSLSVLVVFLIAKALTRSLIAASIAGFLLAIDGLGIVMSRTALLDGILTFFILLGFLFVLYDGRRTIPRIAAGMPDEPQPFTGPVTLRHLGRLANGAAMSPGRTVIWTEKTAPAAPREHPAPPSELIAYNAPIFWRRPWLVAAGVMLGAACAVKWSGLYALAAFGLWVVVSDALARRRAGILLWPTDAVLRQGPVSFVLVVGPALLTYLLTWTGWFVTAGGYARGNFANPFTALVYYHSSILGFHSGLSSSHPYASPAWQWPLLLRPTAVWVDKQPNTCGTDNCISVVSTIPNPLLWYGGVVAVLYLVYRITRGLIERAPVSWVYSAPLVGIAATYLPWLFLPNRTIFQFYTVAIMPFLVLALVLALRDLAGRRDDPLSRRQAGERTVIVILVGITLVSVFFYPVWTGMSVPYEFWLIHNWLPGWI